MSIRIIIVLFWVTIIHDSPYVKNHKYGASLKIEQNDKRKIYCKKLLPRSKYLGPITDLYVLFTLCNFTSLEIEILLFRFVYCLQFFFKTGFIGNKEIDGGRDWFWIACNSKLHSLRIHKRGNFHFRNYCMSFLSWPSSVRQS